IVFSVTAHDVHIRDVYFSGAGADEIPPLKKAALSLSGQNYSRTGLSAEERFDFLPVFLRRGYLKASFGDAQPKIAEDTAQETTVDVTSPVEPGKQYKLTEMGWAGNSSFTTEELQGLVQSQKGQPANAIQLDEDLKQIQKLYGTRGLMAAELKPVPE